MEYQIVFTDIDGTLLDENRDVSEFTVEQVKRIKTKYPFVLVSARMPKQMQNFEKKLGNKGESLIAYNGALVLYKNEVVHSTEIPIHIIEEVIGYNESLPEKFHISLFNQDEWYVEKMDFWANRELNNTKIHPQIRENREVVKDWKSRSLGAHKIMCMGEVDSIQGAFDHLQKKFGDDLHLYRSKDTYIEIANKEVSKLTGIRKYLEQLPGSIPLEAVIAFGDNYNDVEMIGSVGHGVAVENAREEVKQVAKAITDHHKKDGVAKYLAKFLK